MKKHHRIIWVVGVVWMIGSCTLYRQMPIEVLRTKEVIFPQKNPGLVLLYRNFKFDTDTLQTYFLEDGALTEDRKAGKWETDSLIASACLTSIAGSLKKNGICENPVFYPMDLFPAQSGKRIIPLPPDLTRKLAMPVKADYVVCLETITYFFIRNNGNNINEAWQQVKIAGVWNLYNSLSGTVEDHKTLTDTLYWDNNSEIEDRLKSITPPRMVSMVQAAGILGENYASRFYSDWETVERMLIIPPLEDFRIAAEFADKQQWNKAAEIWSKYSERKFGKLAISACYNLALSSEITDDFMRAKEWIGSAVEMAGHYQGSDELEYALRYQEILNKRIHAIEKTEGKVPD